MATITEKDREIFNNIGNLNESSEQTYMDVDVFFDLLEEMIDKYYDERERVNDDNK